MLGEEQILWDVVEEHLDEAEFLVEQWQSARRSASYTLAEIVAGPEARLEAHVDGLQSSGPLALERVAWPVLEDGAEPPERVAAAALALLDGGDLRVLEVLDALGADQAREVERGGSGARLEVLAPPEPPEPIEDVDDGLPPEWVASTPEQRAQRREADLEDIEQQLAMVDDDDERARLQGLRLVLAEEASADAEELAEPEVEVEADGGAAIEAEPEPDPRIEGLALALALASHPQLDDQLRARAAKADGPSLALLLGVCADRGLHPGPALERGLLHDEPAVVQAALRAAAFGERTRLLAAVETHLLHRSPAVRLAALDTAILWGSRAAWELIGRAYGAPNAGPVRVWIACLGDDRHAQALVPLLDDEALRHDVLWALGFSGRVPAVEACLRWLDDDDQTTRRLAGEAVAAIVGLDPEDDTLWEQDGGTDLLSRGIEGDGPEEDEDELDADLREAPEDELPLPNAEAIRERWGRLRGGFVAGQRYILGKPVGREGLGWALPMLSCRRVDVVARELVARSHGVGRWPERVLARRHQRDAEALAELGRQAGSIHGDRR
ncbi:MAG: hypothetical protein H6712_06215 [Myxococcales bacterium]|nr:hypothetical protein [Myxococcales bacterium]MCB9713429.1 hypothetical protein [Myxococcales bacterium]